MAELLGRAEIVRVEFRPVETLVCLGLSALIIACIIGGIIVWLRFRRRRSPPHEAPSESE